MSTLDPTTQRIIDWAKRTARACGRNELTPDDVLCGLYANREAAVLAGLLPRLVAVPDDRLRWPGEVETRVAHAMRVPEVREKLGMDPALRDAVDRAHAARSDLAPEALVANVLRQPTTLVAQFLDLNRGRAPGSKLVAHMADIQQHADRLATRLNDVVLGQQAAVQMLADAYYLARLGGAPDGPRGVFTFLGPPGVGKTMLAEAFGEALGSLEQQPYAWRRFDMSTYSGHQNHEQLFGTAKFYSQSQPGILTGFVHQHPRCVLLFDEIEKAHDLTIASLLSILDKGEAADNHLDQVVSFRDAWIVFTTNLGREFFDNGNESGFLGQVAMSPAMVFDLLASARRFGDVGSTAEPSRPALPPEFVSRLAKGGAVIFNRLDTGHYLQLLDRAITRQVAQATRTAKLAMPTVVPDRDARFLFLASLLPEIDARRTVARGGKWAIDVLKSAYEECRDDLHQAAPEAFEIRLSPDPASTAALDRLRQEAGLRVLVVDEDDFLPPFLADACRDHAPRVSRVGPDADIVQAVRRERPTLVLLDLSIDEPADSPRMEAGLSRLESLRTHFPDLPVYVYSENPQDRASFDQAVGRILKRGGARGYLAIRRDADTSLQSDDLVVRLDEILSRQSHEAILRQLRRGHKTLTFRSRFSWDAPSGAVHGTLLEARESVVVSAEDRTATIRFSGVPDVTFADVVGLRRAKRRLTQVVAWLKNPGVLGAFGMRPPRGFLLAGPPGTGKTLLARAVAGEAGLPFLALSAGELQSKWVGESEARIRELFERAREYAPSIVFLDEIDGIARARSGDEPAHQASAINQLLASMDGFGGGDQTVFVLAATNHPQSLDPALVRPGRFDEVIPIDLPDSEARRTLFGIRLARLGGGDLDLDAVVAGTAGCSPAQIDRIVREAIYAISAAGRTQPLAADLEAARRLVVFGAAREDFVVREDERRVTAWHEAGHAVVHLLRLPDRPLDHLTIVPSESGALGFLAWRRPEDRHDLSRNDVAARIAVALAGREAERLLTGRIGGAGARSDLHQATGLAWSAVTAWGFDEEFGPVALDALPDAGAAAFGDLARRRVEAWIRDGEAAARELLTTRRDAVQRLADRLLAEDSLDGEAIRRAAGLD